MAPLARIRAHVSTTCAIGKYTISQRLSAGRVSSRSSSVRHVSLPVAGTPPKAMRSMTSVPHAQGSYLPFLELIPDPAWHDPCTHLHGGNNRSGARARPFAMPQHSARRLLLASSGRVAEHYELWSLGCARVAKHKLGPGALGAPLARRIASAAASAFRWCWVLAAQRPPWRDAISLDFQKPLVAGSGVLWAPSPQSVVCSDSGSESATSLRRPRKPFLAPLESLSR